MGEGSTPGTGDRRELRHSVRTLLNHIAGYADILRQEAEDLKAEGLPPLYDLIRQAALDLRSPALEYFRDPSTDSGPADRNELLRLVYGYLYDIIGQVQAVKRRLDGEKDGHFLPDTEKILEAANGIVGIFEASLEKDPEEDPGLVASTDLGSRLESSVFPKAALTGRILVVDDNEFNRELLARHLERQGHLVCQASDGVAALEVLREAPFDILILDVMMPGMNGYQLLEAVKSAPRLKAIHTIVISALDDTQSIARCIQLGAEDYLPREFEPVILRARIESCLEKRRLKAKEEVYLAAVRATERSLRESLAEGAEYVTSLLPPRLERPGLRSDWAFIPSRALGGDVFGYHSLGGKRMAIFLLDVSGHGIGAALYSVTLMNLLKTRGLPDTDFEDPGAVLASLNRSFQMEDQNNLYFTAWYGVWDERRREIRYASAGGPPALVIHEDAPLVRLETGGTAIGIDPDAVYSAQTAPLPLGSRFFLFSDGAYEFRNREGAVFGLDTFMAHLSGAISSSRRPDLASFVETLRGFAAEKRFEDDVSLVEFDIG